jgi:hypothetical protein
MINRLTIGRYIHAAHKDVYIQVLEVVKEYNDKVHIISNIRKKNNDEIIEETPMYIKKANFKDWFYYYGA